MEPNQLQNGHKKQLLHKLMTNLLGKPGRSMHEIINGVKEAVGAYKNYAREWDNLNGLAPQSGQGGSSSGVSSSGGGDVQKIMRGIQEKKSARDGSGGPGMMPSSMPVAPRMVAPQTVNASQTRQPPVQQMPSLPPANVPPTSGYRMNPPVSNLGIYGY